MWADGRWGWGVWPVAIVVALGFVIAVGIVVQSHAARGIPRQIVDSLSEQQLDALAAKLRRSSPRG